MAETAAQLRLEAYEARARKAISLIADEADWSATAFVWLHSTQAKKKPQEVRDRIEHALKQKAAEVAGKMRFG